MLRIKETLIERQRVTQLHRNRLRTCLVAFQLWVQSVYPSIADWWESVEGTNQLLCEYINSCHEMGTAQWRGRYAIVAVQTKWRGLKGKLGRAWDAMKSWQMTRLVVSRTPVTLSIVKVLFATALSWALEDPREARWLIPFAVLIRVMFFGLLRPGEAFGLTATLVSFMSDWDLGNLCVLTLVDTKNRRRMGRLQFGLLKDASSVAWLRWLTWGMTSGMKLWPSTAERFGKLLTAVARRAGLAAIKLTPSCFRTGGTTHRFVLGESLSSLKFAGRWGTESSLELYVQEAMSYLNTLVLDAQTLARVRSIVHVSAPFWQSPPAKGWQAYFSRAAQWQQQQLPRHKQWTGRRIS